MDANEIANSIPYDDRAGFLGYIQTIEGGVLVVSWQALAGMISEDV